MDSDYKVKYFPTKLHKYLIFVFNALILTFKERQHLPNLALCGKTSPLLQGFNTIITINFQRRLKNKGPCLPSREIQAPMPRAPSLVVPLVSVTSPNVAPSSPTSDAQRPTNRVFGLRASLSPHQLHYPSTSRRSNLLFTEVWKSWRLGTFRGWSWGSTLSPALLHPPCTGTGGLQCYTPQGSLLKSGLSFLSLYCSPPPCSWLGF